MLPIGLRWIIVTTASAATAGMVPAVVSVLAAQVRKCYAETCTTVDGKTVCFEREVPCPTET